MSAEMSISEAVRRGESIALDGLSFTVDLWKHRIEILKQGNFSSACANLPSDLLVSQDLTVFARLYGVPRAKRRIEALLELLDITHLFGKATGLY